MDIMYYTLQNKAKMNAEKGDSSLACK